MKGIYWSYKLFEWVAEILYMLHTYSISHWLYDRVIFNSAIHGIPTGMAIKVSLKYPGPHLNIKMSFLDMRIPVLKIRRSRDRLFFNMGIPMLVRRHLYIETARRSHSKFIWLIRTFKLCCHLWLVYVEFRVTGISEFIPTWYRQNCVPSISMNTNSFHLAVCVLNVVRRKIKMYLHFLYFFFQNWNGR